ncbi:hypothetical protein A0H81_06847 [Grifola frondosa]|uniref:Uncharacterized protein n=1 Tax=Grifola frondosa TaxID=5627 RepID=A0A1C7M7I3_GRIFR|nr:hypothetical protein A0H81_06847 [Grifola frondosa]
MANLDIRPEPQYPDILVSLHLINTNPPRFHWALFVPDPVVSTGTKFHAVTDHSEPGSGIFTYDKSITVLPSDRGVATAAIIGSLGSRSVNDLDTLLSSIPCNTVPSVDREREPRFTCRVWLREAVRRMHGAGFIRCADVDALEKEILFYGEKAAQEIDNDTFEYATLHQSLHSF